MRTDPLSPKARSAHMAKIRGAHTQPERRVRSVLHSLGLRFRLHQAALPGRPDIVLRRHGTVVFVHGCFWHRHAACRGATTPKTNRRFWLHKFRANLRRDAGNQRDLRGAGWRVVVVWECELARPKRLEARLRRLFGTSQRA
jgi:DNA mismatch endonuclease (patch repair protein)